MRENNAKESSRMMVNKQTVAPMPPLARSGGVLWEMPVGIKKDQIGTTLATFKLKVEFSGLTWMLLRAGRLQTMRFSPRTRVPQHFDQQDFPHFVPKSSLVRAFPGRECEYIAVLLPYFTLKAAENVILQTQPSCSELKSVGQKVASVVMEFQLTSSAWEGVTISTCNFCLTMDIPSSLEGSQRTRY